MATITETVTLESCRCASCGVVFAMPDFLKNNLRNSHDTFYCPSGHSNCYPAETEAERLRKELKRKEQELADKVMEKITVTQKLEKAEKDLKRLSNGLCSCCNRSFRNLALHMKRKHPEKVSPKR